MVDDVPPPKSTSRLPLVGFAIRVCLWVLLLTSAMFMYSVVPQLEQSLEDRGIELPAGLW